MKILVVDDERTLVKGIKFNLENEGYQVECAYDGAAAVELRARDCNNVILSLYSRSGAFKVGDKRTDVGLSCRARKDGLTLSACG